MKRYVTLIVLFAIALTEMCLAQIPQTIQYQGKLTDMGGVAMNGEYDITFSIWDNPVADSQLWTEDHNDVAVQNGIFNIVLGKFSPLALPFDEPYWLQISVNGWTLSPRLEFTSSPYAFRAAVAESLLGGGGGSADNDWQTDSTYGYVYNESDLIGIGTPAPAYKLDVHGDVHITGDLTVDGADSTADDDWLGAGTGNMYAAYTSDDVGIGVEDVTHKLHVEGYRGGWAFEGNAVGYFVNTYDSMTAHPSGIYAECAENDGIGYGGYFVGGNTGVVGAVNATGDMLSCYGVSGVAHGNAQINCGVYGDAYGATTNWAAYFASGNVKICDSLYVDGKGGFSRNVVVSQDITVGGDVHVVGQYGDNQFYTIGPIDMNCDNEWPDEDFERYPSYLAFEGTGPFSNRFYAPIHIPHGSVFVSATIYYYFIPSLSYDAGIARIDIDSLSGYESIFLFDCPSGDSVIQSETDSTPESGRSIVDNQNYMYYMWLDMSYSYLHQRFHSCVIEYKHKLP